MGITNVNDETYLAAISQIQATSTQQANAQTSADKTENDFDSYISAILSADTVIPSSTYNANGLETETFSPVTSADTDSKVSTEQEETAVSGAAGGGGGSSDSEEETETEVVTINGVTYLQTTTTDADGNTTVTRTQIGGFVEQSV